jgi:hypothetical protein
MSTTTTAEMKAEMHAALAALEQAAVDLAAARDRYHTAYRALAYVAYAEGGPHRQAGVETAAGVGRVDQVLAARLHALGLGPVLDQVPSARPSGPEWVATFQTQIEALVP